MADYYDTLGIDKNASDNDIKKAFKKLAAKHHPDAGGDEAKFKEINEAYQTLKDPQKRRAYDNPAPEGFHFTTGNNPFEHFEMNGEGFGDISDIFSSMFGRPGGFHRARQKGRDIQLQMPLTLEEIASGVSKTISVDIGTGKNELLNIDIPPGIKNGYKVRYKGKGQPGPVERGDLFILINQLDHPRFERQNNDIYSMQEISVWDALLGCSYELETVNKRKIKYAVKPNTQTETRIKLSGQGINGGNHYVILRVKIPERLTENEKQVILKLKNKEI